MFKELYNFYEDQASVFELSEYKKITDYLDLLDKAFNIQETANNLNTIIKFAKVKSDNKYYKSISNALNGKNRPEKATLLKMCFVFNIRKKDDINKLFDAAYRERLYVRNPEDAAWYFFLTNVNMIEKYLDYDAVENWIKNNITERTYGFEESMTFSGEYTAQTYQYLDNIPTEAGLLDYLNSKKYNTGYEKHTLKKALNDIIYEIRNINNWNINKGYVEQNIPHYTARILNDDSWDYIFDQYTEQLQYKDVAEQLLISFAINEGDSKSSNSGFINSNISQQMIGEASTDKLTENIKNGYFSRGVAMLLLLYILGKNDVNDNFKDNLDVELDKCGFALLNPDGIMIDKIVCDAITYMENEDDENYNGNIGFAIIEAIYYLYHILLNID